MVNLDLRHNNGYTKKVMKIMALCLLKNLDKLRKSKVEVKKRWLNTNILLFDTDNFNESNTMGGVSSP